MKSLRIVELVDSLAVGGTERMAVHLSRGLQARGHEVAVVCLRTPGPLAEPLHASGIRTLAFDKPEGLHWPTMTALRRFLAEFRPGVVHTHNPLVHHYGVFAGRRASVPLIVSTVHGIANIGASAKSDAIFAASCLFTDSIVAVCRMARDRFAAHPLLPSSKLRVVYNGIPLEPYLAIPPLPDPLPAPSTARPFVFGAVGRLVPVKDHATLLRAFSLLAAQHPHCRLEFLGGGALHGDLQRLAAGLGVAGRVVFHGERAETRDFYESIHAYVMSSLSEGLPMTLLEAMAAARPIVSTAVGGIPELVENAQAGWLCPPSNSEALTAALASALAAPDLAARGLRARQLVQQCGSLDAMVRGYEEIFSAAHR